MCVCCSCVECGSVSVSAKMVGNNNNNIHKMIG